MAWTHDMDKELRRLEADNKRLREIIEEAISQHHRVAPNTIMDGVARKYEALKEKE